MIEQALTIAKRLGMGRVGFAILGATAAAQLHAELTAAAQLEAQAGVEHELSTLTTQLERMTARVVDLQAQVDQLEAEPAPLVDERTRRSPVDPGAVARLQSEHTEDRQLPATTDSVSLSAVAAG